jgi:hypothetical protein
VYLQTIWIADYDEKFPGQMIFQSTEGIYRIPEWDLIITEEITREDYNKY